MRLKYLLAGAVFAAGLMGAAAASADTVLGTESADGFVGNLIESVFPGSHYLVASDGESAFDPFHAGFDTSDGVNFSGVDFVWTQAADSHWTEIGHQTWVLPADLTAFGCGTENEPICEPVGHFISAGAPWNEAVLGTYLIMDADGSVGDRIKAFNTPLGAELTFESDPFTAKVPEASTWALMLVGFGGMGAALRRRKLAAVA